MDRTEPYKIAQDQLISVEDQGFDAAREYIGSILERDALGESGSKFDVELIYEWFDLEQSKIRVTCRVTSLNWQKHAQLEEGITLSSPAI